MFRLMYANLVEQYKGYIEARSLSHKMRISSSGLGLNLPLVAPIDGVGNRQWGIDFWEVSMSKLGCHLMPYSLGLRCFLRQVLLGNGRLAPLHQQK